VVLVECPSCHAPLVGQTATFMDDSNTWKHEPAERVWPAPSTVELSLSIPELARRDIKDARKCLARGINSAAIVLCGRALERFAKINPIFEHLSIFERRRRDCIVDTVISSGEEFGHGHDPLRSRPPADAGALDSFRPCLCYTFAEAPPDYFVPLAGSGSTRSPLRGNLSSFPSVLDTGGSRTSSPEGGPGCSGSVGEWGFGCMARFPDVCGHCSQLLE
jgi:hypothetical protein